MWTRPSWLPWARSSETVWHRRGKQRELTQHHRRVLAARHWKCCLLQKQQQPYELRLVSARDADAKPGDNTGTATARAAWPRRSTHRRQRRRQQRQQRRRARFTYSAPRLNGGDATGSGSGNSGASSRVAAPRHAQTAATTPSAAAAIAAAAAAPAAAAAAAAYAAWPSCATPKRWRRCWQRQRQQKRRARRGLAPPRCDGGDGAAIGSECGGCTSSCCVAAKPEARTLVVSPAATAPTAASRAAWPHGHGRQRHRRRRQRQQQQRRDVWRRRAVASATGVDGAGSGNGNSGASCGAGTLRHVPTVATAPAAVGPRAAPHDQGQVIVRALDENSGRPLQCDHEPHSQRLVNISNEATGRPPQCRGAGVKARAYAPLPYRDIALAPRCSLVGPSR